MLGIQIFDDLSDSSSNWPTFWALITVIPLLILVSPGPALALANNEYKVYRMQQYDFAGKPHGCRNAIMSLEARTRVQITTSFAKKCVIMRLQELIENPDTVKELRHSTVVGGVLILLPAIDSLTPKQFDDWSLLEQKFMEDIIHVPVYFVPEDPSLIQIYESIVESDKDDSDGTFKRLANSAIANGYQIAITNGNPAPIDDALYTNIEGRLSGNGIEDQLPTVTITAHYDSFGVSPGLSFGGDSNGSGVIALLELARIFSKIYANNKDAPQVNLLFLLTSNGKFGYIGTKKWLESSLDTSDSALLTESMLTVCLDSIGGSRSGSTQLFAHVSKPPKEGSPSANFLDHLRRVGNVNLIHKKINLADEYLAWEHERFSIRRLPAITLSSCSSHKDPVRGTIADIKFDLSILSRNIERIGGALVNLLYGDTRENFLKNDLAVSQDFIKSLIRQINSAPRAQQLLITEKLNAGRSGNKVAPVVKTMETIMRKYLKEVKSTHYKSDGDLLFFKPIEAKMSVYNIKPAIFDLILSVGIILYLQVFYLFLNKFRYIQSMTLAIRSKIIPTPNADVVKKSK